MLRSSFHAGVITALFMFGCDRGEPKAEDNEPVPSGPRDEPAPTLAVPVPAPEPTDARINDTDCKAEAAWVTAPSFPDPGAFVGTSNCAFHRWAFQTFLWLTSPGDGGQRVFEGFANPASLFVAKGPSGKYPGRDGAAQRTLLARVGKSESSADVEDVFQAGPGNKILVDRNGEVVYYSNHLNETFWNFIVSNRLYDLKALQTLGADVDFPAGSLELKAAWRVAEKNGKVSIENATRRFYVIDTSIPKVRVDKKGQIVEERTKLEPAKMALIGMHVTGVVKGHPEFIWATFEHVDNAPDCALDRSRPAASGPGPSGPWSLYEPGAITAQSNQFDTNDPLGLVNVCRVSPQGGGDDDNVSAVKTLNQNVRKLKTTAPWNNYELGGAIWTTGDVPLNNAAFAADATNASLKGSLQLANTTMETFTQSDNCFACHNAGAHEVTVGKKATEVNGKHINLSHFVVNYQAASQAKR